MESVPEQQPSSAPVLWAFVAAVSGPVCMASAWWLGRNELPNGFQNEYEHFYTLTEFFFRFRDNGWDDAQGPLWGGYYPPLNHVVASAAMFAFEPSREVAILSQSVFLLVLLFSTAWIGRRAGGP